MHKLIIAITISAILALAACVYVMEQNLVVSQRGNLLKPIASALGNVATLDSNGFSLLSWNMKKGMKEGWEEDFRRLSYNKDLLIIQEVCLTDAMRTSLQKVHHHWDLVKTTGENTVKTPGATYSFR